MSKPIEDAADIISEQQAKIEELESSSEVIRSVISAFGITGAVRFWLKRAPSGLPGHITISQPAADHPDADRYVQFECRPVAAAPAASVAVPAGFDVAGLREELWRLSEHTETFGSCADAARIAFEGAIQALDEFAAAPATPAAQAQQPAGDGWIACADRMPAEADPVLVYVPGDPGLKIWIDTWQEQFDCPVAWSTAEVSIGPGWDDHEFEEVTHWMPLPLPPAPGLMEAE